MPVLKSLQGDSNAPQQHRQPSRKGKKAWRKNVDVTEVQEGLDLLNDEIIRGGVVAEKASQELFILDTAGDASKSRNLPKVKRLKVDEIIAARSAVPGLPQRKRAGDKTTDGIVPAKRARTEYVAHKELARLRETADGHHESTVTVIDAAYDVWDMTVAPQPSAPLDVEKFIPPKIEAKAPLTLQHKPLTLAANGKPVPAVGKPVGGFSYNPAFNDYDTRLQEEGNKLVSEEQQRLRDVELRRIREQASAKSAAEADAAEARAELSEWDEDSGWEGIESEAETATTKRPQRKTPAERNKAKRRKAAEGLHKHEIALRAKEKQAKQIEELAMTVEERERAAMLARDEMSDGEIEGNDIELRRKQLGKFRLPDRDIELVLPDELQESLRLLKPEGNLLKDRYRSALVRGRIEARRKIPFHKKARTKFTEKWTHKDFRI